MVLLIMWLQHMASTLFTNVSRAMALGVKAFCWTSRRTSLRARKVSVSIFSAGILVAHLNSTINMKHEVFVRFAYWRLWAGFGSMDTHVARARSALVRIDSIHWNKITMALDLFWSRAKQ
jgi:hypothetical protein